MDTNLTPKNSSAGVGVGGGKDAISRFVHVLSFKEISFTVGHTIVFSFQCSAVCSAQSGSRTFPWMLEKEVSPSKIQGQNPGDEPGSAHHVHDLLTRLLRFKLCFVLNSKVAFIVEAVSLIFFAETGMFS